MTVTIDPDDALLEPHAAIGSLADCLARADIDGPFDTYRYCVANGRQVLLGHQGSENAPVIIESFPRSRQEQGSVNHVFVSKGDDHNRNVYTWEELRKYLSEGWMIGTRHHLGVKIQFVSTARNSRREPEGILLLPGK